MEYILESDTLSNSAVDVSKHVEGFIPARIIGFSGDSTTNTLACLTTDDRAVAYVYRVHWENKTKVQSAWGKWTLGKAGDVIHGMKFIDGHFYLIVTRDALTFLEKVRVDNEMGEAGAFGVLNTNGTIWPVLLDRRVSLTGTYDAGNDWTTWTVPYLHGDNLQGIKNTDWTEPGGRVKTLTYPTTTTVRRTGLDLSANPVIFGVPYDMTVPLSTQYVRETSGATGKLGRSITNGTFMLKRMDFDYKDTGYFEVHGTPRLRAEEIETFTGRILGDPTNIIGEQPIIDRGTFRARTVGENLDLTISIQNPSHVPCIITSAVAIGVFNEITRQE